MNGRLINLLVIVLTPCYETIDIVAFKKKNEIRIQFSTKVKKENTGKISSPTNMKIAL